MRIFYLGLHHGGPLCSQHFDSLEDVHSTFVAHPLQHNTEGDEDAGAAHSRTATETVGKMVVKTTVHYQVLH